MNTSAKLKAIETQITNEENNLIIFSTTKKDLDNKINKIQKNLIKLREERRNLLDNDKEIVITEHAILRFLERVKKIDLESIKKEILSEQVIKDLKAAGNCTYPRNGYRIVYRDKTIITIKD